MKIALSISYLLKLSLAWKLGSTGSRPAQHMPFCTLVSARQRACSERPAVSLACLSSRTAHTVANTQRSGTHAKLFHTDGAAALGATEAASIKLCDAATESAAGVATRGSLLQEPSCSRSHRRATQEARAPATLTAYVSMDEDLRNTGKE